MNVETIPHVFTCPQCKDEFVMLVTLNDLQDLQLTYGTNLEKIFQIFLCSSCEDRFKE